MKKTSKDNYENNESDLFKLDKSKLQIKFQDEILVLTQAEYEVLACLIEKKNAIVSREQIVNNCDSLSDSYSKSLDVIIGRLRTKLNEDSKNIKYLHSVRGLGYKISQ
jgi:two-component system, OmpR family, response regulator